MGSICTAPRNFYWKTQLPIDYIDTSLTINTFEDIIADLSGGKPARLWYIIVEQTNNGAAVETVELEFTFPHPVTGVATPYVVTLTGIVSGTMYYVVLDMSLVGGDFNFYSSTTAYAVGDKGFGNANSIPFKADNVGLIRVRQTSAVDGVSAQIEVNIVWEKLTTVEV